MAALRDLPIDQNTTPSSHRRQRLSPLSLSPPPDVARSSKRQKLRHPAVLPPGFWDTLSEKHLTRNALRELDRRNAKILHESTRRQSRFARRDSAEIERPESIDRFLGECSPTRLEQIKRCAGEGGPDLRDLRGYRTSGAGSGMCSGQSGLGRRKRGSQSPSKKSNTTTTKSTGPYDRDFHQHLIDHDILPHRYAYPDGRSPPRPGNLEEIREALRQRRPSLSPSLFPDDKFDAFQQADEHATKESHIIADVIPIIEGNVEDRKCIGRQVPFTNLDHLTDGTLVPGNPDVYYGARPEQLDRNIRRELNGQIIPSTQQDLPLSPNFFLEVKGPDGSLSVASRQACYDGALGARGMHSLQSYGNSERRFDNQAYTLTSIYHGGQLKVYTSHPIPPSKPGAEPGYVMTLVKAWALTSDPDSFRQGAAGYRNGRDWAKQQRDEAIRQANEKVPEHGIAISVQTETLGSSFLGEASPCDTIEATSQETIKQPRSNAIPLFYDSNTSADELSLHSQPPPKRSHSPQKQLYTARSGQGQKLSEKEADLTPKNPFKNGKDFHLLPDSQEESE